MTKKVDTWMPLLVDKYLGDTTHLTTEQHGAYLLLLMSMWKRDGVLPADDGQLAQITRLSAARWKACRPVLLAFFTTSEDGTSLTQKRLAQELQRSKAHTEAKAKAGAKGAAKKWGKDGSADGGTDGTAMAQPSHSHWQTGASTPPPTATQSPKVSAEVSPPPSARAFEARFGEPEPEPSPPPSMAGVVCAAMRQAGMASVQGSDPRLLALLAQGATVDEFAEAARAAVAKGKPWGWALGRVEGMRRDAASIALPAAQPDPMAWRKSPESVRAKGAELGVEVRPGEMYDGFERRVVAAFRRRTAAAGATT